MNKIGTIILAAGRGSRMKSKDSNKVTLMLGNKPMIMHAVHLLEELGLEPIVIVIGFAKESVKSLFDKNIIFAEQNKRLGTAHAVSCAVKVLPEDVTDVLIIQGDDSAFYKKDTILKLITAHVQNSNEFTFLSISVDNPTGLGRVIRDENDNLVKIVEEKDATEEEKKINEINPACYVISTEFLKKYLRKVHKSPITGEYYLTSLIDIAIQNREKIQAVSGGSIPWRGVNTREELQAAQVLFSKYSK
jgi:bifunctional UDP-N-acetylglucosamine pyrophosphorylase / glucosamine-1-phosphate N-acetyltransferase